MRGRRGVVAGALALVLVAVAVVVGLRWWRDADRTRLERAVAMAPGEAQRYSWTDWAAVRAEVDAAVTESSGAREVGAFLDAAYELDLASTSALVDSAPVLHTAYGFSPATVEWELFSQGEAGAVVMLGLPESADFDALATRLDDLGYTPPAEPTGSWYGGKDLVADIGGVTPELQYLALDEERRLVLASDTPDFLLTAVDAVSSASGPDEGVADVVAASGSPLAAAVYAGDHACATLAMGQAGETDQRLAEELLAEAGEVNPLTGFAMSVQPGGGVRVAMGFETDDQARTNADTRAVLARGPAAGQGGDFADRFAVDSVTADGRVVRMELDPAEGTFVLSDLSTGPVLFATC